MSCNCGNKEIKKNNNINDYLSEKDKKILKQIREKYIKELKKEHGKEILKNKNYVLILKIHENNIFCSQFVLNQK